MILADIIEAKKKHLHISGLAFKLKTDHKKFGEIKEVRLNSHPQFELINIHKELIAIGRMVSQSPFIFEVFNEMN